MRTRIPNLGSAGEPANGVYPPSWRDNTIPALRDSLPQNVGFKGRVLAEGARGPGSAPST